MKERSTQLVSEYVFTWSFLACSKSQRNKLAVAIISDCHFHKLARSEILEDFKVFSSNKDVYYFPSHKLISYAHPLPGMSEYASELDILS